MTITKKKIEGDRFLAISEIRELATKQLNKQIIKTAEVSFSLASKAKAFEAKGVHIYSEYAPFMQDYEDIDGFLDVFLKKVMRITFYILEKDGHVEVSEEYFHNSTEISLQIPLKVDTAYLKGLLKQKLPSVEIFFD